MNYRFSGRLARLQELRERHKVLVRRRTNVLEQLKTANERDRPILQIALSHLNTEIQSLGRIIKQEHDHVIF